jgi:VWFA-related protein
VCLPAFSQQTQTIRIGVVPLTSRRQQGSGNEARDELVAALNRHQFDRKLNLAVQAVALDASAGKRAIAEGRSRKCEFVLYMQVQALQKSNVSGKDAKASPEKSEVDMAMLEYQLRRISDGSPYSLGIVKSEGSESATDALLDAVSRIPNKLAADFKNSPPDAERETKSGQAGLQADSEPEETAASCARLAENIPHAEALREACRYAVLQPVKMPNVICEQETSRFVGHNHLPTDLITSTIRFVDGEESFSNLKRNGRPAPAAMWNAAGLWSSGQLEGDLRAIFHPSNHARFEFSGETKIGTRSAWVFTYQIARQYEPLWQLRSEDQLAAPPYEGELWIDQKSGAVERFRSTTNDLPPGFPIRQTEILTDYENVLFPDGTGFNLPSKSTITTRFKQEAPIRNVVEFRDCRKFRAVAHMLTELPAGTPGAERFIQQTTAQIEAEKEENETIYAILRDEGVREDEARTTSEERQQLRAATGEAFWKLAQLQKELEKTSAGARAMRPPSSFELTTSANGTGTYRVNVHLVPVSVVVRDSKGHPVGDLKQENFQILDNRKPQDIVTFTMEKNAGAESAKTPAAAPATSGVQKPEKAGTPAYVAYLFDDIHISNEDMGKTKGATERHLKVLTPNERVAIYTVSGDVSIYFTADRDKLQAGLKKLRSHSGTSAFECPQLSYYTADLIVNQADPDALQLEVDRAMACNENGAGISAQAPPNLGPAGGRVSPQGAVSQGARQLVMAHAVDVVARGKLESDRTLAVLNDVMNRTAGMPGQRNVVLLSSGFMTVTRGQEQASMYLIEHALKTGVIFNSLDVQGLHALDLESSRIGADPSKAAQLSSNDSFAASGVMADLAYGTGGVYFHNNNDMEEGLRRTADPPQYFYLLGFSPQLLDGKFHKLKIGIKGGEKLTVQARSGYYALKSAPNQPASNKGNAKPSGPLVVF